MRLHQRISARARRGTVLALGLALAGVSLAFVDGNSSSRRADRAQDKIEASIFSYDGHDFVRTKTTMLTKDGKSAVDTKLDRDTPAYKALVKKHSYTGDATIFGRQYEADYAPLTDKGDKLTGALFVGVAK